MSAKGKARGLGRGLDALFADQAPIVQPDSPQAGKDDYESGRRENAGGVSYIDINDIKPNTEQPRRNFDPDKRTGKFHNGAWHHTASGCQKKRRTV